MRYGEGRGARMQVFHKRGGEGYMSAIEEGYKSAIETGYKSAIEKG